MACHLISNYLFIKEDAAWTYWHLMFRVSEFMTSSIQLPFLQIILHFHSCLYYLLYFVNCFYFQSFNWPEVFTHKPCLCSYFSWISKIFSNRYWVHSGPINYITTDRFSQSCKDKLHVFTYFKCPFQLIMKEYIIYFHLSYLGPFL